MRANAEIPASQMESYPLLIGYDAGCVRFAGRIAGL